MNQHLDLDQIRNAVAATFDQFEPAETRIARWETAALSIGREVDRNALRAYMAVADAEQQALADDWAKSAAAADAEIRRLRAQVAAVTHLCDEQANAARLFELPIPEWITAVRDAIEAAAAPAAARP
jgi:hypothetical protein